MAYRFKNKECAYKLKWLCSEPTIKDVLMGLAEGGQGAVFQAKYSESDNSEPFHVALKTTHVRRGMMPADEQRVIKNALREQQIGALIKQAKLPHVVKIFNIGNDKKLQKVNMDDQYVYKSFMVMEKADLDLEKFLNFPIEIRAELCYDACLAISEIHNKRIGHRDLKPENFLIFKTLNPTVHYEAKLTDFGCARVFEDWQGINERLIRESILTGTNAYKPPESDQEFSNFKSHDVWSFSLVLLQVLFGYDVHKDATRLMKIAKEQKSDIIKQHMKNKILEKVHLQYEQDLLNEIFKGLRLDPNKRTSDMEPFKKILSNYRGYQRKYRFSNKEYQELFASVIEDSSIADVLPEVLFKDENNGRYVFSAIKNNEFQMQNCALKIIKAAKATKQGMIKEIQNCQIVNNIFDDKLLQFCGRPFIDSDENYGYILMEKGVGTMPSLMQKFNLSNRLSVCWYVLESLIVFHANKFYLNNLCLDNIVLFQKGIFLIPKIINFQQAVYKPSELDQKKLIVKDFQQFMRIIAQILPLDLRRQTQDIRVHEVNSLLDQSLTQENFKRLREILSQFKDDLPTTLEQYPILEKICTIYGGDFKKKILESKSIDGIEDEFRILFNHHGRQRRARIKIIDLTKLTEFESYSIRKQIYLFKILENNQQRQKEAGLLEIFDASYDIHPYAYIITEDYFKTCADVDSLRKDLLITPDQIVEDLKKMMVSMKHRHQQGISHMNITPRNIYLIRENNTSTLKLGNFGCFISHQSKEKVFDKLLEQDTVFKPPEYFRQPYDINARFASDCWMLGVCCVAFLTGEKDAFSTKQKYRDYIRQGKCEEWVRQVEKRIGTIEGMKQSATWLEKIRKGFMIVDYKRRTGLDDFLSNAINVNPTIGSDSRGKSKLGANLQSFMYKYAIAQTLYLYFDFQKFIMINEQKNFINFLTGTQKQLRKIQDKRLDSYEKMISGVQGQQYLFTVSSGLYVLCFLLINCLAECEQYLKQFPQNDYTNHRIRVQELKKISVDRSKLYHNFMQKIKPEITNKERELDIQAKLSNFVDIALFFLLLSRRYVSSSRKIFTYNDIPLVKGIIRSYTVENYLKNSDSKQIPDNQLLQGSNLNALAEIVKRLQSSQQINPN